MRGATGLTLVVDGGHLVSSLLQASKNAGAPVCLTLRLQCLHPFQHERSIGAATYRSESRRERQLWSAAGARPSSSGKASVLDAENLMEFLVPRMPTSWRHAMSDLLTRYHARGPARCKNMYCGGMDHSLDVWDQRTEMKATRICAPT